MRTTGILPPKNGLRMTGFVDSSATCKALPFHTNGAKYGLGCKFHYTFWARDAGEHQRLCSRLYYDPNGQRLACTRQILRVRRLQNKALESASWRGICGRVNRVAAPLDKERKQPTTAVPQVKQSPTQRFAVRARARAVMRPINGEACAYRSLRKCGET
jgi:hypothetical protein